MGCGGPELIRLPQHQPEAAIFRISKGQKREINKFAPQFFKSNFKSIVMIIN